MSKIGLSERIFLSEREFRIRYSKKDTLLSKGSSVGIAYKMSEAKILLYHKFYILILRLKIYYQTILTLLNSIAVKIQAEKDAGGSIINHWKMRNENVIIPIIERKTEK